MSLKSLSKTRWKIDQNSVTVYPYGTFYIFTILLAVIFSALLLVYVYYDRGMIGGAFPMGAFLLLMVLFFWAFASTRIEFDNNKAQMRKMLMGFLPTSTIPFSNLVGIKPVSTMGGTYNYRVFQKDAKYGKGIIVSCAYTKNDDPNAIAFVEEAVTVIHSYLDLYDTPAERVVQPITTFKFFDREDNGIYAIKTKKVGAIVIGLIFLAIGIYLLTLPTNGLAAKVVIVAAVFLLVGIFLNAAFTKIVFDLRNKTVQRTGLFKFFNRQYALSSFDGLQTVRRTINFVYAGTDINMYFKVPEKNNKEEVLMAMSLKRSADIERFIEELHQVMQSVS